MLKKAFLVASALSFLVLTACGEAYVSPFDRQVVDSNTQSSASERDPASVPENVVVSAKNTDDNTYNIISLSLC